MGRSIRYILDKIFINLRDKLYVFMFDFKIYVKNMIYIRKVMELLIWELGWILSNYDVLLLYILCLYYSWIIEVKRVV